MFNDYIDWLLTYYLDTWTFILRYECVNGLMSDVYLQRGKLVGLQANDYGYFISVDYGDRRITYQVGK